MRKYRGLLIYLLVLLGLISALSAFVPAKQLPLALLVLPLSGAVVGLLLPRNVRGKTWGQAVSMTSLFAAVSMAVQFDWSNPNYQFVFNGPAVRGLNMQFSLGVDAISMALLLLTVTLHPLAVTASL